MFARALVGFAFPCYASVKVIKVPAPEQSEESEDEMIQWLCYWLVFATLHIAECLLFSIGGLGFIPFYNEVHTTTTATCRSAVLRGTPACRRAG